MHRWIDRKIDIDIDLDIYTYTYIYIYIKCTRLSRRPLFVFLCFCQEVFKLVPPDVHDWRLFIKPHELSFLLQVGL